MDRKLNLLLPAAWTTGALAAGGFLLYAVGGALDHADLLILVLGSVPVTAFGRLASAPPLPRNGNRPKGTRSS